MVEKKESSLSKTFLINRGYCCGLGCQECPYEPKAIRGGSILSKDAIKELISYDDKKPEDEFLGAKFKPSYQPTSLENRVDFYIECTHYDKLNPIENIYTIRFIN